MAALPSQVALSPVTTRPIPSSLIDPSVFHICSLRSFLLMSRDLFVFLFMISLLLYLVVYYFYLINATPGPSDAFMVKKKSIH
jgi:hypothetical protein